MAAKLAAGPSVNGSAASLFHKDMPYDQWLDQFESWLLAPNTLRKYLRSKLAPTREE